MMLTVTNNIQDIYKGVFGRYFVKTLIIIPAYNEEESIETVVNELIEDYPEYDYIIVNDGSTDDTIKICRKNNYRVLDLPVNLGLAGAFQTGMIYAYKKGYDYAVQFDGDGQHKADIISEMLSAASDSDADIIIGSRFLKGQKKISLRMMGSMIITAAIKITTGKTIYDPTSGMRMYDKRVIKEFAFNINYGPEPDTIAFLLRKGITLREIPAQMNERLAGESYFNTYSSIMYMVKMLCSILLLQWARKRRTK